MSAIFQMLSGIEWENPEMEIEIIKYIYAK